MNSQSLMLRKEDVLSPPKIDDETMQPQINWILIMPVAKEILIYLDKVQWKPEYFKVSKNVHQRVQLVLQFVTSCSECLVAAKESGNPTLCSWFCKDCMKYKRVCSEHENLYTDWLCDARQCDARQCDARQCEQCLRRSDKCVRFSVLLSISDEASCYEKYGRSVSSSLWDTLDGQGNPVRHIHDVGHHLKNAQA